MSGFEVIESGELFKFENVGDKLAGKLVSFEERPDTGKGVGNIYEVKTNTGIVPFFASSILHKKLKAVEMGDLVKIEFTEATKTKTGNDLKLFEVARAADTDENRTKIGLDAMTETEKVAEEVENF